MVPKDKLERKKKSCAQGRKRGQVKFRQGWMGAGGKDAVDGLTRHKWVLSVLGHETAEFPQSLLLNLSTSQYRMTGNPGPRWAVSARGPFKRLSPLKSWRHGHPKSSGHQRDKTKGCATLGCIIFKFCLYLLTPHPHIFLIASWHLNTQAFYLLTFHSCSILSPKPCLCWNAPSLPAH